MKEAGHVHSELCISPDNLSFSRRNFDRFSVLGVPVSVDYNPVMKKGASRAGKQSQKSQHWTCSVRGPDTSPAAAIFPYPHSAKQEKKQAWRMAFTAAAAQESGSEDSPSVSPDPETTQDVITRPILAAIDASKVAVMVSIEHLTTECTLIRHDLDKMRGRITEAEDRISVVEDTSLSGKSTS